MFRPRVVKKNAAFGTGLEIVWLKMGERITAGINLPEVPIEHKEWVFPDKIR